MAGTTIKLQTNIPLTGVIEYCDFIKTRNPDYSDQIAFRGKWDGAGDGRVYLPLPVERDLQSAGIIGQRQDNGNYPLSKGRVRVKILKVEQGTTKHTTVELLGADSGEPTTTSHVSYSQPSLDALARPVSHFTQKDLNPTTTPPFTKKDLVATMEYCLAESSNIWVKAGGSVDKNCHEIALLGAALFTEMLKRGLLEIAPVEPVHF